jgi:hypothetical protein
MESLPKPGVANQVSHCKKRLFVPQKQGYHLDNGLHLPPEPGKTGPARYPGAGSISNPKGCSMSAMLYLWIVWAGVLAILLILLAYRGTLTRYEEDQLFLDEAGDHQKKETRGL